MSVEQAHPVGPEELKNKAEAQEQDAEAVENEGQEAEAERPLSRFERITGPIKEFWKTQFKGEVREKTEDQELLESMEHTTIKAAGAAVPAIAGAVVSLLGVKSLMDVPRYLTQKHFTEKEKSGLLEAFEGATKAQQERPESAVEKSVVEASQENIGSRTAELRAKIEGSKFMTAEKKAELLEKVEQIESKHGESLAEAEDTRSKEFAAAIDEAIETKVKGTTALKETLNTMAVASGLSAARAMVFGGVSLFERYQKVSAKMEAAEAQGEKKGSLFNEMVVKGLKETFKELSFQEGHTTGEKLKNAAEALASVMRFAGMAAVGLNELNHEGISGAISKAIEGFKHEKLTTFVGKNFSENTHHLMAFLRLADHGEASGDAAEAVGHHTSEAMKHASDVVAGSLLSHETVAGIQEGLHIGETKLEVGTQIHEEVEGEVEHDEGR